MKEFLKIAGEINTLVLEHNITTEDPKYFIKYSVSQAGNMMEVLVHTSCDYKQVASADVWNLNALKDDLDVENIVQKLKAMKKLVKKYIKLNNN